MAILSLGFLSPFRLKSPMQTQKIKSDLRVRNEGLEFIFKCFQNICNNRCSITTRDHSGKKIRMGKE